MTEVTPHPLKTQGFHHFFILLFYDHPADAAPFPYFLKLSFKDTLRLNTRCSGLESLLSRQK